MRRYCHDLIGRQVVAADGQRLGRITDLVAERRGEALRVTTLIVGGTGLLRRIGFRLRRAPGPPVVPPRHIPWRLVARIEEDVHLHVQSAVETVNAAGLQRRTDEARGPRGGLR